jgi:molybdenum cofactor synthesis domain-containing protein
MSDPAAASPTAAVLVIGDEILSGRTKDGNSGYIAERLTVLGIDLKEIRVVADDEGAIVAAVNALRACYTYVFTTGGIGPTHDDITADSMAAAFGVGIDVDARAVALMQSRFPDQELNEGRMRMARIPHGADLIANSISKAPGFRLGNVFVMAGVPAVMHVMLDALEPALARGVPMLSEAVRADAREGDVAMPLAQIQRAHPQTAIGSYPFADEHGYNTSIVVRSRDAAALQAAVAAVRAMLAKLAG